MITIKHILCPIDMSMNSNQALRYAIPLARAHEAQLIIRLVKNTQPQ
jgi:nucleotide-binding universal stress UspA family protein